MRPSLSFSKAVAALFAVCMVAGLGAAAPPYLDSPDCSTDVTRWAHASCVTQDWTTIDTTDLNTSAWTLADEAEELRSEYLNPTKFGVHRARGLVTGEEKLNAIAAVNAGTTRSEFGDQAVERLDTFHAEMQRRLLKANRQQVNQFQDLLTEYNAASGLTPNDLVATALCGGTPDALQIDITEETMTLLDGSNATYYTVALQDQNTTTAGSCAGGSTQDRSRTIIDTELSGSAGTLNVTNSSGSERVFLDGTGAHNVMGVITGQHSGMSTAVTDVVDAVFSTVSPDQYSPGTVTPPSDLLGQASGLAADGNNVARALPALLAGRETAAQYATTIEYNNDTLTGQLAADSGAFNPLAVNTTYSVYPVFMMHGTDKTAHIMSGNYTVTEIVNRNTGETVANYTINRSLFQHTTPLDLGTELASYRALEDQVGNTLGGITGRISAGASQLFGAIWDLVYQYLIGPILGVIGL